MNIPVQYCLRQQIYRIMLLKILTLDIKVFMHTCCACKIYGRKTMLTL